MKQQVFVTAAVSKTTLKKDSIAQRLERGFEKVFEMV